MKFIYQIFITLLFVQVANSQLIVEDSINISANNIFADKFDNLYVLTDNDFIKYSYKGVKLASFSNEAGDEITSVDVRNPFKIILFFKNQNKIILLDNNLNEISDYIYLDKFEIYGDAFVIGAKIGGFWIFDSVENKLIKLNSEFKIEYSKNIKLKRSVVSIVDNFEKVFLLTSLNLIAFDFNTLSSEVLPIYKLTRDFKIEDNVIICYSSNMHSLKFQSLNEQMVSYIKFSLKFDIKKATVGKNKIFFCDKNKVYICLKK